MRISQLWMEEAGGLKENAGLGANLTGWGRACRGIEMMEDGSNRQFMGWVMLISLWLRLSYHAHACARPTTLARARGRASVPMCGVENPWQHSAQEKVEGELGAGAVETWKFDSYPFRGEGEGRGAVRAMIVFSRVDCFFEG